MIILKIFVIKFLLKDMDLKIRLNKLRKNFYLEYCKISKKTNEFKTTRNLQDLMKKDIMKKS